MKSQAGLAVALVLMMAAPAHAATLPVLTPNDASVVEGDTASVFLVFTVQLSEPAKKGVRVDYTIAGETAAGWVDYKPISGRLSFRAGALSQTVSVEVLPDTLVEGPETFRLVLSNVRGATLAATSAVGTIVDNDATPP